MPNPVLRIVMTPDRAPRIRRLYCRLYDHCLDLAIERDWPGFGCGKCDAYVPPLPVDPPGTCGVDSSA